MSEGLLSAKQPRNVSPMNSASNVDGKDSILTSTVLNPRPTGK